METVDADGGPKIKCSFHGLQTLISFLRFIISQRPPDKSEFRQSGLWTDKSFRIKHLTHTVMPRPDWLVPPG